MPGGKRKSGGGGPRRRDSSKRAKAVIQDVERLKCPICLEFPRASVYLCSNGHSVCSSCMEKLTSCPICRAPYQTGNGAVRVRNHLAEEILDNVLIPCSWREQGCKRQGLSRQQISEHEEQCQHNPNRVKLCEMMLPLMTRCPYKVASALLKNPIPDIPADFREHLRTSHQTKIRERFVGVKYYEMEKPIFETGDSNLSFGHLLQLQNVNRNPDLLGYFMNFCYKDDSVADPKLFWFMVRVTDKPQGSLVSVKFTLKGDIPPDPNNAGDDNPFPNPELSWNGRILGLREFIEFRRNVDGERAKFQFPVQLSHLREWHLNAEGELKIFYEFTVTPQFND